MKSLAPVLLLLGAALAAVPAMAVQRTVVVEEFGWVA